MKRYCVRVVVFGFQRSQAFDGLLSVLFDAMPNRLTLHRNDSETVFDINPPNRYADDGKGSREWANRFAERMTDAGFNAVAAPEFI